MAQRRVPCAPRAARTIGAALALCVLASCRAPAAPPAPTHPDVVLVVVESLRADHLGVYGYGKPTSPHLDALARAGTRFADARATSSWTLPSVVSMLTALYPATHGVDRPTAELGDDLATMPAAFHAAGYATAGISADPPFVTPLQGFDRQFDEFVVMPGRPATDGGHGDVTAADPFLRSWVGTTPAAAVTAKALDWIAGHAAGPAPYFLELHYFDPHAGYFPPASFASRFGVAEDDPLRGDAQWHLLATPVGAADPRAVGTLIALYDGEIAYVDEEIGALVAGVRERDRRPTLFVVVGDHGEELNDHGGLQHGRTLYDEVLRVPWIVSGAGIPAGGVVSDAVSLVSLWPTVAELAGLAPPAGTDGASLAPLARATTAQHKVPAVYADLESIAPGVVPVQYRAVVAIGWKLAPAVRPIPSIFDLANDPLEQIGALDPGDGHSGYLDALLKVHERTSRMRRHPTRLIAPPSPAAP